MLCKYFTWSLPGLILLNLLGGRYDPGPAEEEAQGKGRLSRRPRTHSQKWWDSDLPVPGSEADLLSPEWDSTEHYLPLVFFIFLLFLIMTLSDFSPRVLYSVFRCFKGPPLCEGHMVRTGLHVSSSHATGVWDSG